MKWISVKDKKPKQNTYTLVWLDGNCEIMLWENFPEYIPEPHWYSASFHVSPEAYQDRITHWMPLPEPPSL